MRRHGLYQCDHCLGEQRGYAFAYDGRGGHPLCHPDAGLDCYHLVTVYRHPMFCRLCGAYRRLYPDMAAEDIGTVRWFGAAWPSEVEPAPICHPGAHIPVPIGQECGYCRLAFTAGDRGVRVPYLGEHMRYSHYGLRCWMMSLGLSPEMV